MLKRTSTHICFPNRQRGVALLMLLTLFVLAASYTLLKQLNKEQPDILRSSSNAKVLNAAKAALMGYALKSTTRPGELPCPDTDNDGDSNVAGACTSYLGRLPWRTLGLADPRDTSGERLWYALDAAFDGTSPINSDTAASLLLDGGTEPYVALVFAPGEALDGQSRPPGAQNTVSRYLEDDNNNGDLNYVSSSPNDFDDQLVGIEAGKFIQAVERRVLTELQRHLETYYIDNDYYPYPAVLNGTSCDSTLTQGHLPVIINATCSPAPDWSVALPAWFTADSWNRLIWYAIAPACTQTSPGCTPGGSFVHVNNAPGPVDKHAILISAGRIRAGQIRPPLPLPLADLTHLLDSAENADDHPDLLFDLLPINAASNDQIKIVAP